MGERHTMSRAAPVLLVLAAALADTAGAHVLAFDALLLAVPVTAVAGLRSLGEAASYLWGVVLALLLVATASRAPALGDAHVPAFARSALFACVAAACLQALVALAGELRSDR